MGLRRRARWASTALAALAAAVLVAACGGDDGADGEARQPPPRSEPLERADLGPALPRGWSRQIDVRRGIAIGVPPGWDACSTPDASALVSPDRLVVVSLASDRTSAGATIAVGEYAGRTASALPGYEPPLEPGEPRPFGEPLEGAIVAATGRSAAGAEQDVELVAMRDQSGAIAVAQIVATRIAAAREPLRRARRAAETVRLFAPAPAPEDRSVDAEDEACPPPVRRRP